MELIKKLKILISLLFLSISFTAIGQNREYIVKKNKDTLYGKVYRGVHFLDENKIVFKFKGENGKKIILKPDEVSLIRKIESLVGENLYASYKDREFLRIIINGEIKLYANLINPIYYISKGNEAIEYLDTGYYQAKKIHPDISALLIDKPIIYKEYTNRKTTLGFTQRIIKKYNALSSPK